MSKLQISVLMGGPSLEHKVSLVSGSGIVRNLSRDLYDVYPVYISEDNLWVWRKEALNEAEQKDFSADDFLEWENLTKVRQPKPQDLPGLDLVFLGLHGSFGEDGRLQAWLDLAHIPYTGSGMFASALALDKIKAKCVYKAYGIPTADWVELSKEEFLDSGIQKPLASLKFPWFCKDPLGGSSIAMGKAHNELEAQKLLNSLFEHSAQILIEPCIVGTEVSCGFIEGQAPCPATEIRVEGFFDFEAKYQGKSQEITPAEISEELMLRVQEIAKQSHLALGLSVYSRTDMILSDNGIVVLETNTLPGFTPTSLLPQQAEKIGLSYSQLLDVVVNNSLKK